IKRTLESRGEPFLSPAFLSPATPRESRKSYGIPPAGWCVSPHPVFDHLLPRHRGRRPGKPCPRPPLGGRGWQSTGEGPDPTSLSPAKSSLRILWRWGVGVSARRNSRFA